MPFWYNMAARDQVFDTLEHDFVNANDGARAAVRAETVCVQVDAPTAPQFARFLGKMLGEAGVDLRPIVRKD